MLSERDEEGQMLLATGIVLMMSLLSMAIFGVKMAGDETTPRFDDDESPLRRRPLFGGTRPSLSSATPRQWQSSHGHPDIHWH